MEHSNTARLAPSDLFRLTRPGISAAAAALAGFGAFTAGKALPAEALPTVGGMVVGIFLLTCGASALNQVQEKNHDALMRRTRSRPLPAGHMSRRAALAVAGAFACAALGILAACGGLPACLAAVCALLLYNGCYTPLKRRSSIALFVGALAGASPLPIGTLATGGDPAAPLPLLCFIAACVWQVPHFWLRALRHKDDYLRAGFAVPFLHFSQPVADLAARLWLPLLGAALLLPALAFTEQRLFLGPVLGLITLSLTLAPLVVSGYSVNGVLRLLRMADYAVCAGFTAVLAAVVL